MITYSEGLVVFSAAIAARLYVACKFDGRLKHHHPAEWEELERLRFGKPMLPIELHHFTYFATRKYRALGDTALTQLGDCSIALDVVLTLLFILTAVLGSRD